ncbi:MULTISPECIES: dienelactone hydrolase family protein [unclassified Novosphingobium]|uniref:dienelactone hydrolase family protein n=1 Tax=unclassified Novosphingobium TaxID=2644732 RepID=UPI000EBFA63D|nr:MULTISPECIES: dienelactone hydrolase family protein [unclassified Novosphingobium]HCF25496.1 dienelactone hydrolase [Novosphingobium sp.]HQV03201.1 dienelactone hydrolase family protein [Novosphingobium sp.]
MCDELTAIEEEQALAAKGFSRREFAAIGAAGVLAACTGGESQAKGRALKEAVVSVPTPDGSADAFFVYPAKGKYPAVILWPDVAGLRDAYKEMARRLAANGFAVLAVNHYYRAAKAPLLNSISEWRSPAGQEKLKPAIATLSPNNTVRDAAAFVAWLDKQGPVNKRKGIGTQGYCQTGSFAIRSAAALPGRIKAAASFHGGGLVTDKPDSPHRLFAESQAGFLIAIARNDDARAPADKDALRTAAKESGKSVEVEVYNADHGWCTLDAPVYDKAEADRAWARLLELYKRL